MSGIHVEFSISLPHRVFRGVTKSYVINALLGAIYFWPDTGFLLPETKL
jgi:hypothetical protein